MLEIEMQELLALISELAIAFAGFTGIVAVMGNLMTNGLLRMRIAAIMVCAFGTMILSLIPMVMASFSISESSIWFWSNLLLAAYLLSVIALGPWINRLRRSHKDLFSIPAIIVGYASPALGSIFGLIGLFSSDSAAGWFVAGLVFYLAGCLFLFVRAILTARENIA